MKADLKKVVLVMFLVAGIRGSADELSLAIRLEDGARVEAALRAGKEIGKPDRDGLTPLFYACVAGRAEWVKTLLEKGANPNEPGQALLPLWATAVRGDLEIARKLLEAGATLEGGAEAGGKKPGSQPFYIGSRGAWVGREPATWQAIHPVFAAIQAGNVEMLELLLKKKPDLDLDMLCGISRDTKMEFDLWNQLPVTRAIRMRQTEMATFLIKRGCRMVRLGERRFQPNYRRLEEWEAESYRPTQALVAAIEMDPLSAPLVEAILGTGAGAEPILPDGREQNGVGLRWQVRPWDGLTAAAYAGRSEWVKRFLGKAGELPSEYLVCLRHLAHVSGDRDTIQMVEALIKPAARITTKSAQSFPGKLVESDTTRFFLPRIGKTPANPAIAEDLKVALFPDSEAVGECDSLAVELSKVKGWAVIERAEALARLQEKELAGMWTDGAHDMASIGDRLHADLLLLVSKIGGGKEALLRVEVVDVRTGLTISRTHSLASDFEPGDLAARVTNAAVTATRSLAASGGKIAAINLLSVAAQRGMEGGGSLARIAQAGLVAEIDATPGAIAMSRRQMQPLIEEKTLQAQDSLWRAAWSVDGGLEPSNGGKIRLVLRATHLGDGRVVDESIEGTTGELANLTSRGWQSLAAKSGLVASSASAPSKRGNRESSVLLKEADWLIAAGQNKDALELIEAAILLGADPAAVVPKRLNAAERALPWPGESGGIEESQSSALTYLSKAELCHPNVGIDLAGRLSDYEDFLALLEDSLDRHASILSITRTSEASKGKEPNELAWDGLLHLMEYRMRLPEYLLEPETRQSLSRFDEALNRTSTKLVALMLGDGKEPKSVPHDLSDVDFERFPHLRELVVDWIERILNKASPQADSPEIYNRINEIRRIGFILNRSTNQEGQRLDQGLVPPLIERMKKSHSPTSAAWSEELHWMIGVDQQRGEAARRSVVEHARIAMEHAKGGLYLLDSDSVSPWVPVFDRQKKTYLPSSGDALCPDLLDHPKAVGEWIRQEQVYRQWLRNRERAKDDPAKYVQDISKEGPREDVKPLFLSSYADPYERLLKNSYVDVGDDRGAGDLALRILKLSESTMKSLVGASSGLSLAQGRGGFGLNGMIPEIAFADSLSGGEPLVVKSANGPAAMMAGEVALTGDGSKVWFSGITTTPGIWRDISNLPNRANPGSASLAVIELKDGTSVLHTPKPLRPVFNPRSMLVLGPQFTYCAPGAGAAFAVMNDGRIVDWGDEVRIGDLSTFSGGHPVEADGTIFQISGRNVPEELGGGVLIRIYALTPGKPPLILSEVGRKPARTPFDDPEDHPSVMILRDGKMRVFSNTEYMYQRHGPNAASYDLKSGVWGEMTQGPQCVKGAQTAIQTKLNSLNPQVKLPGGKIVTFSRWGRPSLLSLNVADRKEPLFIPVSLLPPEDFPIRFKSSFTMASEKSVVEMVLSARELARTAYHQPYVIGQSGDSLIVTLGCLDSIYPMVWKLPLREIESRIMRLNGGQ